MNIIDAILNLVNNPITTITDTYKNKNRANASGDALEEYVKDLFAGTINSNDNERLDKYEDTFSYTGNSNNPPDAILKYGDAVEIKKIESNGSALALNSSYPKHKIYSSSTLINNACRNCEKWTEKDIIYCVGLIKDNKLKRLCMVYGLDYCATEEVYTRLRDRIKDAARSAEGVEFSESKELAHVNKVDPLGITYLRVRGMWGIDNPWTVFSYLYTQPSNCDFDFFCIINNDKLKEFYNYQTLLDLSKTDTRLTIQSVKVKNPDNPVQRNDAILITFKI